MPDSPLRLESELNYEMDQRAMMKEAVEAGLAEGRQKGLQERREEGIEAVFKLLEKGVSLAEAKEILHSKKKKTNRQRR
jgi:predicted transposase YdaD